MSEIKRFVTVNFDDNEGETEYLTQDEAVAEASKHGYAVAMRTYVLEDVELVWTPNGENFWPVKYTENDRLERGA